MLSDADKQQENIQAGVSILVQNKKPDKRRTQPHGSESAGERSSSLSFRLKSLRNLLIYLLLFAAMAITLLALDGIPHLPERIWSWAEIWDKLSGPAVGVPLDFIKYLTCNLGWLMLTYVAFTLLLEGIVDIVYVISIRLSGGHPGKIAVGLKRAAGRLPVSPLRRALDGLLLGAAFFAVVTTVGGGRGAAADNHSNLAGSNNDLDWQIYAPQLQAASLVLEMPSNHEATSPEQAETFGTTSTIIKTSFELQSGSPALNYNSSDDSPSQGIILPVASTPTSVQTTFYSQQHQTVEMKHRVQPGDSLWKLAEHYYGKGKLYPKIYQANLGQPMGKGGHFPVSGVIQPGWILTIPDVNPAIAQGMDNPSGSISGNQQAQTVYVVQPGDSMRAIAQKLLGNEMRWPEIWKLNANHTMQDGRAATNPDLIFPGWELELPGMANQPPQSPAGQSQPQPANDGQQISGGTQQTTTGDSQNGQPPATVVTPAPTPTQVQSPPSSNTTGSAQSGVITAPASPSATTAPAAPTPVQAVTPKPEPQFPPVTNQPVTSQPVQHQSDQQAESWLLPILEGLGVLLILTGVGLGLRKVGGALRRRWKKGGMAGLRRSRWQTYRAVNQWEEENAPQLHATLLVSLNEWGEETGFATTERPLELLKLRLDGFDVDRPKLILSALQDIFATQGLPALVPISCIEANSRLIFHFTGSPQTLAAYLNAMSEAEGRIRTGSKFTNLSVNSQYDQIIEEEAGNEEGEEEVAGDSTAGGGKIISFLPRWNSAESKKEADQIPTEERTRSALVEAVARKLGGEVSLEKQREGLTLTLEGVELSYCYSLVTSSQDWAVINNSEREIGFEAAVAGKASEESEVAELLAKACAPVEDSLSLADTLEQEEVYEVYQPQEEEAPVENSSVNFTVRSVEDLQRRSYNRAQEEFAQISRENRSVGASVSYSQLEEAVEQEPETPGPTLSNYIFFSIGAVTITGDEAEGGDFATAPSTQADQDDSLDQSFAHFQLCLDSCNNLLLVSSKGDEAAQTALYNTVFQLAAGTSPDELAFYLVDRPVTLTEDDFQNIGQEFGLSAQAQLSFSQEVRNNCEVFKELARLPQTIAVVEGDGRDSRTVSENLWTENANILIETLLEELIRRRTLSAETSPELMVEGELPAHSTNFPRLILIISDLATVTATAGANALSQLLSEGPEWNIYVLAAVNYESLALGSQTSASSLLTALTGQFGSVALFIAPDESSLEPFGSFSRTATDLQGEGDMLLSLVNRQHFRMRGFRTDLDQLRESAKLLEQLYGNHNREEPARVTRVAQDKVEILEPEVAGETTLVETVARSEQATTKTDTDVQIIPSKPLAFLEEMPEVVAEVENARTVNAGVEEENQDLADRLQEWRWQMLQKELLQPAITIHVLHGLGVHFGLLPTVQKNRIGKGYHFPFCPDPLVAYEILKGVGLSYTTVTKLYSGAAPQLKYRHEAEKILTPEQTEKLLEEVLKLGRTTSKTEVETSELATRLVEEGFDLKEIEEAFIEWQRVLHNLSWLESDNLISKMQNGDLALLSYLALHAGAQSSYTVGQAILKPTDSDRQTLRNLEVRLVRTHRSLRNLVRAGLQEIFNGQSFTKAAMGKIVEVSTLTFVEEDTKLETVKLNERLVYVDIWELDRLLTEYKRTSSSDTVTRIKRLEEAHWLVQSTIDVYGDEVEESRLKLLGVWGDHHAADWEDLAIMRQHVVQRWFDMNMELGDYYSKSYHNCNQAKEKEHYLTLAQERYLHAALVQPTYPEPVKALIQLYHSNNDLAGLRTIFTDYSTSCKQDDQEPEEEVVELYHKAIGIRRKRHNPPSMKQRKVV